jgi:hypothetical protein
MAFVATHHKSSHLSCSSFASSSVVSKNGGGLIFPSPKQHETASVVSFFRHGDSLKRNGIFFASNNNCDDDDENDAVVDDEIFQHATSETPIMKRNRFLLEQLQLQQQQDEDEIRLASSSRSSYLDDLTPPPVNFARNSILFSDNPSTKQRNNPVLDLWIFCRTYAPAVVTGTWPWRDVNRMDGQPLASLYNMAFVRLPILSVGVVYWKNLLLDGHDLVMDFGLIGNGPQVMNPVLVTTVLCIILL